MIRPGIASFLLFAPLVSWGDSIPTSTPLSICDDPAYRGTADYNYYCTGGGGSGESHSGSSARSAAAAQAAAAQQQLMYQMTAVGAAALGSAIHQAIVGNPQKQALERQEFERRQAIAAQKEAAELKALKSDLKLSGDSSFDGDGLDIKRSRAGDDGELDLKRADQGTGTAAFGLGRKPATEPVTDSSVVDLRTPPKSGQPLGGAVVTRGPGDRAPSLNPAGTAPDARRVDDLLRRSEADPERQKDPNAFIARTTPAFLDALGWTTRERDAVAELMKKMAVYPVSEEARRLYAGAMKMDPGLYARLESEARQGVGHALIPEGFQSENDCVIYALANATNLPYSVAATRAMELLRSAPWRTPEERAHPELVTGRHRGLNAAEVEILAEAFGDARPVSWENGDLYKAIANGHAVVTTIGVPGGEHEVVITRAFRHHDEIYYEVMDSNASPPSCPACRRSTTFWRQSDFESAMASDGLVITPKAGTVVGALR